MSIRNLLLACAASLALAAGPALADATLKSPAAVQKALSTLNRVVVHTQRLIDAKNYTRLPHENGEFKEGAEALEKDIAKEPADFKATVKPLLEKAEADSQSVADAAEAHDDAKLATTHAAFADSVQAVLAAFPASVQPPPPKP
jgi:hypothetical protein